MPQPIKALIIEDDLQQARAFALRLGKYNPPFDVRTAYDAQSAFDFLESQPFDVVTLDYHLPGASGLEVLKKIKKQHPHLPVVMLTGQGDEQVAVQAMRSGAIDYLTKTPEQLDMLPRVLLRAVRENQLTLLLEQSRRRYYDLFHNADIAIFVIDAQTMQIVQVNQRAKTLLGLEERVLLQKAFFNIASPDQQAMLEKMIEQINKTGHGQAQNLTLLGAERRPIPTDITGALVESGGRRLIEMFVTDISEKLRIQRQLQLSQQRLLALFNGITDLICVINNDYRLQMANKYYMEATGTDPRSLMQRSCHEVLFGRSHPCENCPAPKTFLDGRSEFIEMHHNGRVYHISTFPMRNLAQQVEYVVEYVKDVTQQKEVERQLMKAEKMASLGLLSSGIAHELRNPLNVIESARYAIETELGDRFPEITKKLQTIRSNVQRASAIIENLLQFSRPAVSPKEKVEVVALLHSVLGLLAEEIKSRRIRTAVQAPEPLRVIVNVDSLKQAFLNIILNAVQAMPNGGDLIIRCRRTEAGQVQIDFEDTGVGIPKENMKYLFTPFFSTKSPREGTGLGLYLTYMLLKREGGDIRCRSVEGKGTTFSLLLPAAQ
ncbi:MAG: response regulator [candidate division KSB1 bacterium]|nr:response regulator [candidate division KSB1 bacterium]